MRIKDAKSLPEGTPIKVVSGNWAGLAGEHWKTRQRDGLICSAILYTAEQLKAYYRSAGREDLAALVQPRRGSLVVWLRPSDIELRD